VNGIEVIGCRENNLKNINVTIPYEKITVLVGVSGSGKSSLAFDTLFLEGKRRYMESLGVSESFFLASIRKPDVDYIQGLPPTIAIKQSNYYKNPRSSVGTITQGTYYIQLLFATCSDSVEKSLNSKAQKRLTPSAFNLNSPSGMCFNCDGTGELLEFDETLIWPNQNISVGDSGIRLGGPQKGTTKFNFFNSFLNQYGYSINTPIKDLSNEAKVALLFGQRKNKTFKVEFPGIIPQFQKTYKETKSLDLHDEIESFMTRKPCDRCHATGYNPDSLMFYVDGKSIADIMSMNVEELKKFICDLSFDNYKNDILSQIKSNLIPLLSNCIDLGVGYLPFSRKATSLSGGEMQRLRLVSQLSSQISGVLYILDEPSTGMHISDIEKLITAIKKLNEIGNKNTVVLVEHSAEIVNEADYIIEIGPGAGRQGGEIVALGTVSEICANEKSITSKYLSNKLMASSVNYNESFEFGDFIEIISANANNLKDVNIEIPLGCIVSVTGVSGSGKSSLVFDSLYQSLITGRSINASQVNHRGKIKRAVLSDQSPIGKSSRSTVATYTDAFTAIRALFANTQQARKMKFDESHFSYNSKKGQCPFCKGEGYMYIDMSFMPDMKVLCESCHGKRYNTKVLDVLYQGKNIYDILDMTIADVISLFEENKTILSKLQPVYDVGLGYIKLGQPSSSLSGGESQRLKLAYEIARGKRENSLLIFDEPSVGLHFEDVKVLLAVFKKLTEAGCSVIIVEHNVDLIVSSDYVIDIGPAGGENGGKIVGKGTPKQISRLNTPTGRVLNSYYSKCANITK